MKERWVSFAHVKKTVSLADVLARYGLLDGLRQRGDELVGFCPFHEEASPSFRVSPIKGGFQCFGCGRKGNVLDFVAVREGVEIRQAALLLSDWFAVAPPTRPQRPRQSPRTGETIGGGTRRPPRSEENRPLRFVLRDLDPDHPYLSQRGLSGETIGSFGLGYCSRGLLAGRIAIPIRDERGQLVAYAGRWPGEPPAGESRYKLPARFHKSQVVYNLDRAGELAKKEGGLILTEGFFDCLKIHQAGYPNVVALMGSSVSERQRELVTAAVGPGGRLTLWFDQDDAGRRCLGQCVAAFSGTSAVRAVRLIGAGVQPDQLSETEIRQTLG